MSEDVLLCLLRFPVLFPYLFQYRFNGKAPRKIDGLSAAEDEVAHKIETVSARAKLKARREPYWQRISKGFHVGFRKMSSTSAGTCLLRHAGENGREVEHSLGTLEDCPDYKRFDRAVELAREWSAHNAIPLFVQHDADAKIIRAQGFTNVRVLGENTEFEGVRLTKIGGQHGTDEMFRKTQIAEGLGTAMGIVLQAPGAKTVYVVGDTIWRSEVDQTLAKFKPDVVVLNAGDARLVGYTGSIIMGKDDVLHAAQAVPKATIVASHMDAINHMTLSRKELREHVQQHGIQDRVRIPADGEVVKF